MPLRTAFWGNRTRTIWRFQPARAAVQPRDITVLEVSMSETVTYTGATRTESPGLRNAFRIGSVLTAIGAASYIALIIKDNIVSDGHGSVRAIWSDPVSWVGCIISAIGFLVLAVALLRWRTKLPGWAVVTASLSLIFAAAYAWDSGTATVGMAQVLSDEALGDTADTGWFLLWWSPKMLLGLVGFGALAFAGFRTRAISIGASIVLVLAALFAVWPPYPPFGILASLAFFLISRDPVEARD